MHGNTCHEPLGKHSSCPLSGGPSSPQTSSSPRHRAERRREGGGARIWSRDKEMLRTQLLSVGWSGIIEGFLKREKGVLPFPFLLQYPWVIRSSGVVSVVRQGMSHCHTSHIYQSILCNKICSYCYRLICVVRWKKHLCMHVHINTQMHTTDVCAYTVYVHKISADVHGTPVTALISGAKGS